LEKAGLHSEESSSDHTKGPGAAPTKRRPDSHDADKSKNDAVTPHLQEK
jgi:hypothetical protein